MSRVILVDLVSWIGHHRPYFLMYASLLLELGYEVDALCVRGDEVRAEFPTEIERGSLRVVPPQLNLNQRIFLQIIKLQSLLGGQKQDLVTINRWLMVQNAIEGKRSKEEAFVFVLDLQGHLGEIVPSVQKFLLPSAWAGLYVCPPPLDRLLAGNSQNLPIESVSCKAFCSLDESLVESIPSRLPHLTAVHLPDIAHTECPPELPSIVTDITTRAQGRKIVLLSSLTKKHGVLKFLRLSAAMRSSSILFCAIGLVYLDDYTEEERLEVETFLQSPPDNLLVLRDFYPPEEEILNAIFKLADAVYLCYENFDYSSNKLTKAVCLGTPVLVTDNTLLADRVRRYQLGYAVDANDLAKTARLLDMLLTKFCFEERLYRQFIDYYSKQTIRNKLDKLISVNRSISNR